MNKASLETRKRKMTEKARDPDYFLPSYHVSKKLKHKSFNEAEDFTRY